MAAECETALEMARRHVIEAQDKLARQEILIIEMKGDNHPRAAEMGERLLITMRSAASGLSPCCHLT